MKIFPVYVTLLFLMSSLYLTEKFNSIGSMAISAIILAILPIVVFTMKKNFRFNPTTLVIMYTFILVSALSALYNADLKVLISAGMIFCLYLSAQVILPSYDININQVVYKGILWSQIPIILIPLVRGLDSVPYKGIFYNPNALGSVVATIFVVGFSLFIFRLEMALVSKVVKANKRKLVLQAIMLFFLFFLVVLSGSRTSTLAAAIAVIAGVFFLTVRLIKARKFWSVLIKGSLLSFLGIIIVSFLIRVTPFYDYLYQNILYKFERKAASGDILDERGSIWTQTIHDAGLFGKGSSYFVTQGHASHNTFINILGEMGWLPVIFFTLFLLVTAFGAFKYAISNIDDQYKYLPLMLIICFTLLSMGESMLFKLSMLAMFFSIGSTMDLKKRLMLLREEEPPVPIKVRSERSKLAFGSSYSKQ